MFCQYSLNVRNLYACGTHADIKVHVTTERFMSEVRSWSVWQMSRQPTVAVTDKLNSSIFIRSKTRPYFITTDQIGCPHSHHHCIQDSDGNSTKNISPNPPTQVQVKSCWWVNTTHFSLGAEHSENGFETRLYCLFNVTSSARNQAESSI